MKITLAVLSYLLTVATAFTQFSADTIFLNKAQLQTPQASAAYYRIYQKKDTNSYYVEDHFLNGKVYMQGYFSSPSLDEREGAFCYYDEAGNITEKSTYVSDRKNGETKLYTNGKLRYVENYKNDEWHGQVIGYFPNGNVRRKEIYDNGKFIEGACYSNAGGDTVFYKRFEQPQFNGGKLGLAKYLQETATYPQRAKEMLTEGKIYLKFIVDEVGSIQHITVLRGIGYGCDEEAIRVIKAMPNWIPGTEDGIPQKVWHSLSIDFRLR